MAMNVAIGILSSEILQSQDFSASPIALIWLSSHEKIAYFQTHQIDKNIGTIGSTIEKDTC
jgi:hypothetical protein